MLHFLTFPGPSYVLDCFSLFHDCVRLFHVSVPGDLGFDPMNQMKGKTAAQIADLKLKEVKNGRLAMVAIIGMFVQNLAFDGKPTLNF